MQNNLAVLKNQTPIGYWGDDVHGLSNFFIRSALFPVSGNRISIEEKILKEEEKKLAQELKKPGKSVQTKSPRAYVIDKPISTDGTFGLTYTGYELDQNILNVYLYLIKESRLKDENNKVIVTPDGKMYFNENQIYINLSKALKDIEKTAGGQDIRWLVECINYLKKAEVRITFDPQKNKMGYVGNLIQDFAFDEDAKSKSYWIRLNPSLANLYGNDIFSRIISQHRNELKGKSLALWLLNFYSSHKDTRLKRYKVESIYKMCGSSCAQLKTFRQNLKTSLQQLEKVTGWKCFISDGDLVTIIKNEVVDGQLAA